MNNIMEDPGNTIVDGYCEKKVSLYTLLNVYVGYR